MDEETHYNFDWSLTIQTGSSTVCSTVAKNIAQKTDAFLIQNLQYPQLQWMKKIITILMGLCSI